MEGEHFFFCDLEVIDHPLTAEHGWEWFDPIRNTDRFKACLERLKKYEKNVPFDEDRG